MPTDWCEEYRERTVRPCKCCGRKLDVGKPLYCDANCQSKYRASKRAKRGA